MAGNLPGLVIEGVESVATNPAYRQAAIAFATRLRTAGIGTVKSVTKFFQNHPIFGSAVAVGGVDAVVKLASDGNHDAIQALDDAATQAGMQVGALDQIARQTTARNNAAGGNAANQQTANFINDIDGDSKVKLRDDNVVGAELALKDLAQWVKGEISTDPRAVKRYHQNMRLFMAADTGTIDRMIQVFF